MLSAVLDGINCNSSDPCIVAHRNSFGSMYHDKTPCLKNCFSIKVGLENMWRKDGSLLLININGPRCRKLELISEPTWCM